MYWLLFVSILWWGARRIIFTSIADDNTVNRFVPGSGRLYQYRQDTSCVNPLLVISVLVDVFPLLNNSFYFINFYYYLKILIFSKNINIYIGIE
jgi:hypothetical protein